MKKIMIALFLISIFLMPKHSFALSCVKPSPPNIAYYKYDAVIIGTVQKIDGNYGKKILTINVDKSFKGIDKKIITVEEDISWGESELNFTYLYFLNKEGKKWIHPLCTPTTNTVSIVDKFSDDKEEIPLKDVMVNENEPKDPVEEAPLEDKSNRKKESNHLQPIKVLLVVLVTLAVVFILTWKRKKK